MGVLAYGAKDDEAIARVQALALRVVADRLENDEAEEALLEIPFKAARASRPARVLDTCWQLFFGLGG